MRRLLPTFAAFALVIAGVVGGLLVLSSRDHGSLQTTTPTSRADGPAGLPTGNLVVQYASDRDRDAIDALAAELGAVDTPATRAAGQALVSKHVRGQRGILATTGSHSLPLSSASDPRLAAFVREHLGRTDQP
ncbi:MAG: hypothetical protein QM679_06925 [Patulibacter sp.]